MQNFRKWVRSCKIPRPESFPHNVAAGVDDDMTVDTVEAGHDSPVRGLVGRVSSSRR